MLGDDDDRDPDDKCDLTARPEGDKSLQVQLVLSLALGVSAFLIFCVSPRLL